MPEINTQDHMLRNLWMKLTLPIYFHHQCLQYKKIPESNHTNLTIHLKGMFYENDLKLNYLSY
jgi:hypothetical protein